MRVKKLVTNAMQKSLPIGGFILIICLLSLMLPSGIVSAADDHPEWPDATPIAVPSTTPGIIESQGDRDWFKFPAEEGTDYRALVVVGTLPEGYVRVYRQNGAEIGSSFTGDFSWTAPATEDNYVEVWGPGLSTGTYQLEVTYLPFERGDILLCRTPFSPIPADEFTHAGIYVGCGKVIEAVAFETTDFYGNLSKGVIETNVETWVTKPYVAYLRVITASASQRDQAAAFAEEQVGGSYDFSPGLNNWYCSKLVWAAYWNVSDGPIDIEDHSGILPEGSFIWPDEIYQDDDTERIGWHYDYWPITIWDGVAEWAMWLGIRLRCPVDLEVIDPDGLLISKQIIEVSGALYGEDENSDAGDWISIPVRKTGDYLINIKPEPESLPTDTYDLEIIADAENTVLVDDVQISDIPDQGYVIRSTETGIEQIIPPSSECFIATSAYGTPMANEIQALREFRDEYLLTNPLGQALVDVYYRVSPPIAEFITEHPSLKPIVRAGLLPAVAMSTIAVNTFLVEKIVIVGLLVLVSVALAAWSTRRRSRDLGHT